MRTLAAFALLSLLPHCSSQDPQEPLTPAAAAFGALDGTWRGTFVGYDATGHELYRIAVQQVYRTVDAHTQQVDIEDTMPDGTVIRGSGHNVARRMTDGSLQLQCTVEKSTGDRVEHQGRLVTGPGQRSELIWYTVEKGRSETFREWVEPTADGSARYLIHGMGSYDGQLMLMAGEYRRVDDR